MTEQGSVDASYLSLPPNQKSSFANLAGAVNSILGLGTGLRDLYGKALIAESLQLKRTARPPANPQLGMILRPDGKGFDPLNDGGLKMVTWDVATETWVELGSGGGGGGSAVASHVEAYRSGSAQTFSGGWNTMALNSVAVDDLGEWDTTNYRYTPAADGYCLITTNINLNSSSTGNVSEIAKNGTRIKRLNDLQNSSIKALSGSVLIRLTTSDYIDLQISCSTTRTSDYGEGYDWMHITRFAE